jgi:hypothetical protein
MKHLAICCWVLFSFAPNIVPILMPPVIFDIFGSDLI